MQSAAATAAAGAFSPGALASEAKFNPRSWASVRAQFALDPHATNFATFLLAPHPQPVRAAIARYARALDRDAKRYLDRQEEMKRRRPTCAQCCGPLLDGQPGRVALTDSTTMGWVCSTADCGSRKTTKY